MVDVNWALVAPPLVLQLILMIFALVNCVKQEETKGPKWMWFVIIIFVNIVGPVIYFLFGRKKS
ncbi:PLD nuclease N-terminal domain-containing protein [Niallia sp. XMNu-256]|uniref:PLD nuclease N-terminal domain-containing protein n=1 Tax=Niallia sp. XMNu-256 TaxID=3082444 RepID=UPI0030D2B2BC